MFVPDMSIWRTFRINEKGIEYLRRCLSSELMSVLRRAPHLQRAQFRETAISKL